MRFLNSDDVAELVSLADVIDLVEEAYRQLGAGEATDVPRTNVTAPGLDGSLKSLPGAGPSGLGGNLYTGFPGPRGASKLVVLFDEEAGELRCAIEADRLSWLRTGATSGVATDHCAREDASTLGILGSGRQARGQLFAVDRVRDIDDVAVYSPTEDHRVAFAEELGGEVDAAVRPVASPREAVADRDVVCTATTASEPVFEGAWLDPGTHVNAIGAHYPDEREVDTHTVERARVIVDTLDRARSEEGELLIAAEEGAFDWESAVELGDIVAGSTPGRTDDDEVTYMTSGGLATEVLVAARGIDERARERRVGTRLEVGEPDPEPLA